MGIRGFGNIFGEQQTGDVGNVGIDLFFKMLFESLPKHNIKQYQDCDYSLVVSEVEDHRLVSVPYQTVQLGINITHHLPSEYINYLENPMEIIDEAEKAAERDIWSLMQFTDDLRRQYGKEPRSMEKLLKKLYVRRMAADLGITRIFTSGKTVGMTTNMTKKVFNLMMESMRSDVHRNSLVLEESHIKRGKVWIMQLFDVTCLSLVAKMEEIEVPLSVDLQVEECKFIFEAKTIQIMELLVLSTLKWRMRAVTPFTFMDYFFRKNNDDLPPPSSQIS
ncbi:hypothetical protein GIB67_023850 [Kingdonia uniflora]|uniref:Transcription-repair-coupling factor C-terminal domain-containing protein n=1 Tax=Kingdonia uniflora TaxID=39325 RepID=A0A7J7NGK5_9MAGN|nr:hypothetical protein GIB67_023850 [Kingdonia uniflora]